MDEPRPPEYKVWDPRPRRIKFVGEPNCMQDIPGKVKLVSMEGRAAGRVRRQASDEAWDRASRIRYQILDLTWAPLWSKVLVQASEAKAKEGME